MMLARRIADLLGVEEAAILCGAAGDGVAPALGALVGAGRVLAHPVSWRPPVGVPVTLGEIDADRLGRLASLWPGAGAELPWRTRRIDTLYDGRAIGVIALADAAALAGGVGVLKRCRPVVMLRDAAGPVAELLPGYRWANVAGVYEGMPPGRVRPPVARKAAPGVVVVAFDDALVSGGLHPTEPGAPHGGRWTGASQKTWFMLPRPAAGAWRLRLAVAAWGNAAGAALSIEGQVVRGEGGEYGPFQLAAGLDPVMVRLLAPRAVPDPVRWPRLIGMRIVDARLVAA